MVGCGGGAPGPGGLLDWLSLKWALILFGLMVLALVCMGEWLMALVLLGVVGIFCSFGVLLAFLVFLYEENRDLWSRCQGWWSKWRSGDGK